MNMQIMIVDDNLPKIEVLLIGLRQKGFSVLEAGSGDEALTLLESKSNEIDLVLTDYLMPKMTGLDLLKTIREKYPLMPVIIMTAFGDKDMVIEALNNRCDGFIEKPFRIAKLIEEMKRVKIFSESIFDGLKTSPKGYIHGFTMATFLQAVESDRMDCTVKVKAREKIGYLFFEDGELVDAETNGLSSEEAAMEIVGWDDHRLKLEDHIKRDRTIESTLSYILIEGYRLKDERAEEKASPPDVEEILKKGIRLAEGQRFREARKTLKKYLESNPDGARGWLWYSRVVDSINDIEIALEKASEAAPDAPEIIEDVIKLRLAKEEGVEGGVRHCPFCWYLLKEKALQCTYCKAHLAIHKNVFVPTLAASKELMDRAIKRYEKILEKERNVNAHYYLCLAYLNVAQMQEALNQLKKAVNLVPKNKYLSEQLNILVTHLKPPKTASEDKKAMGKTTPVADKGKTILVVVNKETERRLVSTTLTQNGYKVEEAKDGFEALSRLSKTEPDLVLLDIVLPQMDGYKVFAIVNTHEDYKELPIVMLTGENAFYEKTKGELSGATGYLAKPINQEELLETVDKYS